MEIPGGESSRRRYLSNRMPEADLYKVAYDEAVRAL
jgi:hypothetical protein